MAEKDSGGGSIPWPAIIAVLLTLGGATLLIPKLQSSRPAAPTRPGEIRLGPIDVPARLWQDPYQAVDDETRREKSAKPPVCGHELEDLTTQITVHAARNRDLPVSVLGVMVPGSAYAESIEDRLRVRVATLEGLANSGYCPEDGEHIGYIRMVWPETRALETNGPDKLIDAVARSRLPSDNSLVVPYEWCVQTSPGLALVGKRQIKPLYSAVLILWIDDNAMDYPLARLAALVNALNSNRSNPEFTILGPWISDTLRAMVNELGAGNKCSLTTKAAHALAGVRMFSATATAEDALLTKYDKGAADFINTGVKGKFDAEDRPFRFFRSTLTDDSLSTALLDELELRGLNVLKSRHPAKEKEFDDFADHIAIVSEWDTLYARALPLSLAAAAYDNDPVRRKKILGGDDFPKWIRHVAYLRGIDGRVPLRSNDATPTEPGAPASPAGTKPPDGESGSSLFGSKLVTPSEVPEGTNASDYLNRLADTLADKDRELRRKGTSGFRAIGVLGSDLYDKLLVLAALQKRFPGVVFFTTDIDARFELGSEWGAAHNLVIAAPFGLTLDSYYQGNIPPFRYSTQTAIFAATMLSTGAISPFPPTSTLPGNPPINRSINEWAEAVPNLFDNSLVRPRRFEIGHGGAYELTVDPEDVKRDPEKPATLNKSGKTYATLQPARTDPHTWITSSRFLWLLVCLALCTAITAWLVVNCGLRSKSYGWRDWLTTPFMFLVLSAGMALFCFLLAWGLSHVKFGGFFPWFQVQDVVQDGQPFLWTEGISVWPTNAVRFFVIGMCVLYLCKASLEIKKNRKEIERDFCLRKLSEVQHLTFEHWPNRTAEFLIPSLEDTKPTLSFRYWKVYGPIVSLETEADAEACKHKKPSCEPGDSSKHATGWVIYANNLWWEYVRRSAESRRWVRIGPIIIAGMIAATVAVIAFGLPFNPGRGSAARFVDYLAVLMAALAATTLLVYVLDGAYIDKMFIDYLIRENTRWPDAAISKGSFSDIRAAASWYLDIRLIAVRTRVAGKFVYLPLLMFLLLLLSRNSFFANWDWPLAFVLVLGIYLLFGICGAYLLRRAAERARKKALKELRVCQNLERDPQNVKTLEDLIDRVKRERDGAFSILSQYPATAAILLPSGSFGLLALLEFLAKLLA